MPKRKASRRRAARSSWIAPVLLLAIAAFAAWLLFRPAHRPARHAPHRVAVATASPTAVPTVAATPSVTPSPAATATATPSATPSPAAAPSATASAAAVNGPKLALIVDDCGQWIATERGFIALPIPITLSVLPDVHGTTLIAHEAAEAGKGVMLHLPMETISGLNPGPGKVTTEMTDAQITARVESDLAQVPLAAGVNNHEGSKATADARVMHDVAEVLKSHGDLFFIDSRTSAATVGARVAAEVGIPTASRDVFLDDKANVAYVEGQLREAAAVAKRTGSAIAIGHPRPTTLAAVRAMIPELQAEGIHFVLAQSLTH